MGRWIEEHNCDPISTRPTLPEAIWTLGRVGANASHGLRRTNDDKRRAVRTLLNDLEWLAWSDREVARACGVSHTFVAGQRSSVTGNVSSERTYTTKHGCLPSKSRLGSAVLKRQGSIGSRP